MVTDLKTVPILSSNFQAFSWCKQSAWFCRRFNTHLFTVTFADK